MLVDEAHHLGLLHRTDRGFVQAEQGVPMVLTQLLQNLLGEFEVLINPAGDGGQLHLQAQERGCGPERGQQGGGLRTGRRSPPYDVREPVALGEDAQVPAP